MNMVMKLSQKDEIISYLNQHDPQSGKLRGLSQLEAIGMWRIYRLAARIEELRDDGYNIRTEMKRDATGKAFARYFLNRV